MKSLKYNLYRAKYRYAKHLPLTKPVDISLELSSLCNMKCTYCYHSDKKNLPFKMKLMDFKIIETLLHQGAELGVHSVKLNWRGESTLNPEFYYACRRAKALSGGMTYIDRLTNSNFKFDTKNERIFEALCYQTKVKVSYDSFNKKVFEKQRAGGNHDITTANIDKFYNWPGRNNELVIQAVRTVNNKDEDFEGEIAKRWPSAQLSIRDMVEGRVNKNLDGIVHKKRDYSHRQSCIQAHARLIFDWNGEATACCPDIENKIKLGNIKDRSMGSIFNGIAAIRLRENLKSKEAFKSNPCMNCSSFETYRGFKASWHA